MQLLICTYIGSGAPPIRSEFRYSVHDIGSPISWTPVHLHGECWDLFHQLCVQHMSRYVIERVIQPSKPRERNAVIVGWHLICTIVIEWLPPGRTTPLRGWRRTEHGIRIRRHPLRNCSRTNGTARDGQLGNTRMRKRVRCPPQLWTCNVRIRTPAMQSSQAAQFKTYVTWDTWIDLRTWDP